METAIPSNPLAVSVAIKPEDMQHIERARGVVALAEGFVIDSPFMAEEASLELRGIAALKASVKAMREGFVDGAKKIIAHADATFNPTIKEIERADGILRGALLTWTTEQKRLAQEAQRKADDEARAVRQRAEQDAAAARARADQEARQHAANAARLRAEADAASGAAAARLAAQAAKAEEKAVAAVETGEAKASTAMLNAAATAVQVAAPAAVAGFGSRANWIAEWTCPEDELKVKVIQAICGGRTDLYALINIDAAAANKLAKALKTAFNVPGMKAVDRPVTTVRK